MKNTFANHTRKLLCLLAAAALTLPGRAADGPTNHATAGVLGRLAAARATGLTMVQAGVWKEPDKVLPEVNFDGLPIQEVGENLRQKFDGQFDVLFPMDQNAGERDGSPWRDTQIWLRLKDVKAGEIFNAMNLVFENIKTPLRWELLMNGSRPTAMLRDSYEPSPAAAAKKPMVFFVGDLVVDNPMPGKLTTDQLVQMIGNVCHAAKQECDLSIHTQAQLLIVRGTDQDIQFVQSVLVALRDKARLDANRQAGAVAAEPKPKKNNGTNAP